MPMRGQQAHRLDVVAVLQKEVAHEALGRVQVAVGEQAACRGDDFRAAAAQRGQLSRSRCRILGVARSSGTAPSSMRQLTGSDMIDRDRLLEGRDGRWRVLQVHVAVAAFLVQAAEARMLLLERSRAWRAPRGTRPRSAGTSPRQQRVALAGLRRASSASPSAQRHRQTA